MAVAVVVVVDLLVKVETEDLLAAEVAVVILAILLV